MIITSFSEKGYGEYGRRFIEGFIENWKDENLTVYVEGQTTVDAIAKDFPKDEPRKQEINVVDLLKDKKFMQFGELLAKSDPLYRGLMRHPNTGEKTYNFRYDAFKFFRKVYAVTDYDRKRIFRNSELKPFAWLDADIVFHRKLPKNFLTDCLAGHAVAFLGRPNLYSETGFVAWDPHRQRHDDFMRLYLDMYLSGAFRYLSEWHDCQVFDTIRTLLEIDGRNLAKGCDPNHPFVYSVLGTYMDHLKGPERKEIGHSPEGQAHVA